MSNRASAELKIAEAIETVLRGYRLSPDPELARAAAEREIKLAVELRELRAANAKQSELALNHAA